MVNIINSNLLKGAIVAKGYTQADVAQKIGISKAALNNKINNTSEFTIGEVEAICSLLEISDNFSAIFFAKKLDL